MTDLLAKLQSALAERYTIERELGAGGMAIVYLAQDLKHHRRVAIKVFRPDLAEALGEERFLREIETAASLSHPHILTVHDSGSAEGLLYYVMPFVEGESLRDRIDREKQLSIEDALQIAQEVADALSHAHSLGVVHRDIKPANVLMHGGHAVLADFGIARAVSAAGGDRITGTGVAVGTPAYMSPEQASGEDVDARSDIYALGCMVYEMLVGEPPFTGSTVSAVVQQHIAAPPPSASIVRTTVSGGISDAIVRALAKTPADRYSSAFEFASALKATSPIGAKGATPWVGALKVLGLYALGCGGAFLLLDYLVNRFVLSPFLPSFGLVALLSLFPAVAILAYQRARGPAAWTWLARIGIPVNAAGSVLLLALTFGSKDLGAATTSVVIEDEDGNTVERVVPKSEFRKRVTIFFFDSESEDTTADWLQYGIPLALDADLEQDLFIQTTTGESFAADFKKLGYPSGIGLPLNVRRKLAEDAHTPLFMSGTFTQEGEQLSVTITLHNTDRGKLVAEHTFTGNTVFDVADQMSVRLKHDLNIPTHYIEDTEDLPVAEMLTTSLSSYESLVRGIKALLLDNNWQETGRWVAQAIAEDSTNAYAHLVQYQVGLFGNDRQKAAVAIEAAMQNMYRLPERMQFQIKGAYYDFAQQPDKVVAVLRMGIDLFPEDIEARAQLAGLHVLHNERDQAIAQFKKIIEIDPTQYEYLQQLGGLSASKGEFEEAISYFEQYASQFPDDRASYMSLGRMHRTMGDHAKAKEYYDRALLIEPNHISTLVSLAGLERDFGNLQAGVDQLNQALEAAKTPQDRALALGALKSAYSWMGQLSRSIEYMDLETAERQKFTPAALLLIQQLSSLDIYIRARKVEVAQSTYEAVAAELGPPFNQMLPLGQMTIALALEQPDRAEQALVGVEQFIKAFGVQLLQSTVMRGRGRIDELRGSFDEAIRNYEAELADDPSSTGPKLSIGRCYRELGKFDLAEKYLNEVLKVSPFGPRTHHELGLTYAESGETAKAIEHLETALEVWKDADPEFDDAREAREKLEELRAGA